MATERIQVSRDVMQWVLDRTGKHPEQKDAPKWVQNVAQWRDQNTQPTLNELMKVASSAHLPFDRLLADQPPPKAQVPLPDMRTVGSQEITEPSLELLEIIGLCQWRQEWYKDYLRTITNAYCDFVGSVTVTDPVVQVAEQIRNQLDLPAIPATGKWEDRIRELTDRIEDIGVLVVRSSMIRSRHRMLKPKEFRGFALVDDHAPLIFVNGADSLGAQAFTLMHELAHIWLGETALSGSKRFTDADHGVEQWCNQVAAEVLVPVQDIQQQFDTAAPLEQEMGRLVKRYKVSGMVVLIRLHTARLIERLQFQDLYDDEKARIDADKPLGFSKFSTRYRQINSVGRLLLQAVQSSLSQESVTYRKAYELLGISSAKALEEMAQIVEKRQAEALC